MGDLPLPLEVVVRVALEGPNKGEVIMPTLTQSAWDSNVAGVSGHYILFACGADQVQCGFDTLYKKVSDRSFCFDGPVRELRYEKIVDKK